MNPIAIKGIALFLLASFLVGLGYHLGNRNATERYLPQLSAIQAVIEASDAQAKINDEIFKENQNAITIKNADNVASVIAFYDRLLRAKSKAGSGTTPDSPEVFNEPTSQCGTSESDIEFQRACVLDAVTVMSWQEWAKLNRFPIE